MAKCPKCQRVAYPALRQRWRCGNKECEEFGKAFDGEAILLNAQQRADRAEAKPVRESVNTVFHSFAELPGAEAKLQGESNPGKQNDNTTENMSSVSADSQP